MPTDGYWGTCVEALSQTQHNFIKRTNTIMKVFTGSPFILQGENIATDIEFEFGIEKRGGVYWNKLRRKVSLSYDCLMMY